MLGERIGGDVSAFTSDRPRLEVARPTRSPGHRRAASCELRRPRCPRPVGSPARWRRRAPRRHCRRRSARRGGTAVLAETHLAGGRPPAPVRITAVFTAPPLRASTESCSDTVERNCRWDRRTRRRRRTHRARRSLPRVDEGETPARTWPDEDRRTVAGGDARVEVARVVAPRPVLRTACADWSPPAAITEIT